MGSDSTGVSVKHVAHTNGSRRTRARHLLMLSTVPRSDTQLPTTRAVMASSVVSGLTHEKRAVILSCLSATA